MIPEQTLSFDSLQVLNFKSNREYRKFLKNRKVKSKSKSKQSYFLFQPTKTDSINYVKITISDSILSKYKISLYRKLSHNPKKNVEIESVKYLNSDQLHLTFPKMNISEFLLKFENKEQFNVSVSQAVFYDASRGNRPFFSHKLFPEVKMKKGMDYKINLPIVNSNSAIIFYKNAPSIKSLNNTKWKAMNTIIPNSTFTPIHDGFYTFLVVYKWNNPLSFIGNLEIIPLTRAEKLLTYEN